LGSVAIVDIDRPSATNTRRVPQVRPRPIDTTALLRPYAPLRTHNNGA
jgi:hypothetical protein